MVFQGAMNSLNPVINIGAQLGDVFEAHRPEMSKRARDKESGDLLDLVKVGRERCAPTPTNSPAACASAS